jgi:hypothetical protein
MLTYLQMSESNPGKTRETVEGNEERQEDEKQVNAVEETSSNGSKAEESEYEGLGVYLYEESNATTLVESPVRNGDESDRVASPSPSYYFDDSDMSLSPEPFYSRRRSIDCASHTAQPRAKFYCTDNGSIVTIVSTNDVDVWIEEAYLENAIYTPLPESPIPFDIEEEGNGNGGRRRGFFACFFKSCFRILF